MENASNRKQQLEAFQKRMNQSTGSLGNANVNSIKTPTKKKLRSSFSSVKTMGASALKAVLTSSSSSTKIDGPASPTAVSVSESSIELDDARSDAPSTTRRQSVRGKQLYDQDGAEAMNNAARRMSAPADIAKKETPSTKSKTKKTASTDEGSTKAKKQRRATITTTATVTKEVVKAATRMGRRASCPVVDASGVDLMEFVQLDKTKRRETLSALNPQQVEELFVESSRKLLAKKTSLQKQLDDLQDQHAAEMRRLQEQLVDANMRLKQRELVHAQRQADHQSTLQKEHQRLHQAMNASQTNFQEQTSALENRSLTLMEQVAEMKAKVEQAEDFEDQANEAVYFSFQLMLLLALSVATVWAPACVCEASITESLSNLPMMWTFGA